MSRWLGGIAQQTFAFFAPRPRIGRVFHRRFFSLGLFQDLRNNSSSLGMLAAMRLASSRVSSLGILADFCQHSG